MMKKTTLSIMAILLVIGTFSIPSEAKTTNEAITASIKEAAIKKPIMIPSNNEERSIGWMLNYVEGKDNLRISCVTPANEYGCHVEQRIEVPHAVKRCGLHEVDGSTKKVYVCYETGRTKHRTEWRRV